MLDLTKSHDSSPSGSPSALPTRYFYEPLATNAPPSGQNHKAEKEDEEDEEEARIRALVFGKGESGLLSSFGAEADTEGGPRKGGAEFEGGFYEGRMTSARKE